MKTHHLKTINPYFADVWDGKKKFEVRHNDRDFKVGDYCHLNEYFEDKKIYGNRTVLIKITYLLEEYPAVAANYVVFGFVVLKKYTDK